MVQSSFSWLPLACREVEHVVIWLSHLRSGGSNGKRKQPISRMQRSDWRWVGGRKQNVKEAEARIWEQGSMLERMTWKSCPTVMLNVSFLPRLGTGEWAAWRESLNAGWAKLMEGCFWCQEGSLFLYSFQLNISPCWISPIYAVSWKCDAV